MKTRKVIHWIFLIAVLIGALALLAMPFIAFSQLPDGVSTTTNSVPINNGATFNIVNFEWLNKLGRPGIVAVLVFVVGYALRRIENVSNKWLLVLVPIGAGFYGLIGERAAIDGIENGAIKIALGLIISTITVIAVTICHNKLLAWASKKVPALSFLVAEDAKPEELKTQ